MNDYLQARLDIVPCDESATDVMAALLADIGFESFEPDAAGLNAYIPRTALHEQQLQQAIDAFPMSDRKVWLRSVTFIEGRDWNAEWERHYFKPIVIGREPANCVIHSSFHTDIPEARYDMTIDPKMAFGTGHHSTTSLMASQLLERDVEGRDVVDMGTGSGILAILAAMRGARNVWGVEIDPAAALNARENVAANGCPGIHIEVGGASVLGKMEGTADIFLANINRNVIINDLQAYARTLRTGGTMLLSGFYEEDIPMIEDAGRTLGLTVTGHTTRHDDHGGHWACLHLLKNK